jgi:plastocyanin
VLVGSLGTQERIYRNNGALSFTSDDTKIQAIGDSSLDCTVADFDNDGRYDIVTAQGESGNFADRLYRNTTGAVDTLGPSFVEIKDPANTTTIGPWVAHAKLRDQVLDDGVNYVSAHAASIVVTSPVMANVDIQAGGFVPPAISVAAGTAVIWQNNSAVTQSVQSTSTPFAYDSGPIATGGAAYSHVYISPGVYTYSSVSGATGQITVTGSVTNTPATYSGGQLYRFAMPDTAGGNGSSLLYELFARDWPGNVSVSEPHALGLCMPTTYCTAKVNSLGCSPSISWVGQPRASQSSGFVVFGSSVRNNKPGLLFYGVNGPAGAPFQGGFLCVQPGVKRTPAVSSGGTPAPANDCSGLYSIDMNAFATGALGGNPLPALSIAGTVVNCQWWGRDPGFVAPLNTTLTDALQYSICP